MGKKINRDLSIKQFKSDSDLNNFMSENNFNDCPDIVLVHRSDEHKNLENYKKMCVEFCADTDDDDDDDESVYLYHKIKISENPDLNLGKDKLILGLCNPLLDISAKVSKDFIKVRGLKPNSAIVDSEKSQEILTALGYCGDSKNKVNFLPGGSGLNTLRAATWVTQIPWLCNFVGAASNDINCGRILGKIDNEKVGLDLQLKGGESTGTCITLIDEENNERTLVASLGAAEKFTYDFFGNDFDEWCKNKKPSLIYITGFFFSVSFETVLKLAKYAYSEKIPFCINLSATFVCENNRKNLLEIMPYVDILFGNSDEIRAFGEHVLFLKDNSDQMDKFEELSFTFVEFVAHKIELMPRKFLSSNRIVCVTQGKDPVIVSHKNTLSIYPVLKVDNIVDTNGAGDAFVGGFLSQYVMNKSINRCIKCALYVSREVICQQGCNFPEKNDWTTFNVGLEGECSYTRYIQSYDDYSKVFFGDGSNYNFKKLK